LNENSSVAEINSAFEDLVTSQYMCGLYKYIVSEEDYRILYEKDLTEYLSEFIRKSKYNGVFDATTLSIAVHQLWEQGQKYEQFCKIPIIDADWVNLPHGIGHAWPDIVKNIHNDNLKKMTYSVDNSIRFVYSRDVHRSGIDGLYKMAVKNIMDRSGSIQDFSPKKVVTASIVSCSQMNEIIKAFDPYDLWSTAETKEQFRFCIYAKAKSYNDAVNIKNIVIGESFIASLRTHEASQNAKYSRNVLEKCAKIAAGETEGTFFTNGTGKSAPKRTRADGSIARRLHVSKCHEALRLMYWQNGSRNEFANVGPKREEIIFE
jgi:hypothetical protein